MGWRMDPKQRIFGIRMDLQNKVLMELVKAKEVSKSLHQNSNHRNISVNFSVFHLELILSSPGTKVPSAPYLQASRWMFNGLLVMIRLQKLCNPQYARADFGILLFEDTGCCLRASLKNSDFTTADPYCLFISGYNIEPLSGKSVFLPLLYRAIPIPAGSNISTRVWYGTPPELEIWRIVG